jgi:glycosyltransferase involved in cell wall biosynthesis
MPNPLAVSSIAVFAHNEERNILSCLESLHAAGCGGYPIYVLINGSVDRTFELVERYAERYPHIVPVHIEHGDKANAWNIFTHLYANPLGVSIFMDGDVRAEPTAIRELVAALERHPDAHVASAVPASGRHRDQQLQEILRDHGVQGNLYAVRGNFLARIRAAGVHMPVGFVREDGLIGALAAWDLDPQGRTWNRERIIPVVTSLFHFDPLNIVNWRDMRLYCRRRVRYSRGRFENMLIREVLKSQGPAKMPSTVQGLYARSAQACRLSWRGLDTLFDWLALRQIRPWQSENPD